MRTRLPLAMLVALLLPVGCAEPAPSGKSPAELERENRAKGEKIVKLEDDLAVAKAERDRMKKDLDLARKSPEAARAFAFEPKTVDFGFLTAAVNFDNEGKATDRKFDNGIAAYVSLYDQFDSSLKAAGQFRFDLLDLARAKDFVIATWTFEPEAAAKYWQRFPACYQFKLPLPSDLASRTVTLKVTFRQPGKPELTATKELTVDRP